MADYLVISCVLSLRLSIFLALSPRATFDFSSIINILSFQEPNARSISSVPMALRGLSIGLFSLVVPRGSPKFIGECFHFAKVLTFNFKVLLSSFRMTIPKFQPNQHRSSVIGQCNNPSHQSCCHPSQVSHLKSPFSQSEPPKSPQRQQLEVLRCFPKTDLRSRRNGRMTNLLVPKVIW